jgi:hypothetical protein
MQNKLKLGFALFFIGTLGVLSMLTVEIPMGELPKVLTDRFSAQEIKLLTLINPLLLTVIGILIGTALHEKVQLTIPSIKYLLKIETPQISFLAQIKSGIIFGIAAGIVISLIALVFKSFLPAEFMALGSKIELTATARLLYGGITEELLMRYGFMTLVVWVVFKISRNLQNSTYVIGIIMSSFLFAAGHLPVVFNAVPNPSAMLILYIILGNASAVIIFGWLYWKKGLETAMIAHMFAHLTMMVGEHVFQLN